MLDVALAVAAVAGGLFAASVLAHGVAQAAVARAMRRRGAACPFEDDDHRPLAPATALRLAVTETLCLAAACLGALRPLPPSSGRGTPVVLLVAPPVPRVLLRGLLRRLHGAGRRACVLRAPRRRFDARAGARLASALERARGTAPALDVLAYGASATFVLGLLADRLGPPLRIRALLAVGARLAGAPAPPDVELVSVYSLDDPWLQPPDAGRHPAAFNVALRDEGHCGLVRSRRAAEIVWENLTAFESSAGQAAGRGERAAAPVGSGG